jgi:hypothetical protein
LKNKQASAQLRTGKKTFAPKELKHEIHLLCKDNHKDKVLDQYLVVIHSEKAKLKRKTKKAQKKEAEALIIDPDSDSESDSEVSMNMIGEISPTKKQKLEKYKDSILQDYEKSEEEQEYLRALHAGEDTATSGED